LNFILARQAEFAIFGFINYNRSMLKDEITRLKNSAVESIVNAKSGKELFSLRVKYLGRKSKLNKILRNLKNLPIEERRSLGPLANIAKKELEEAFNKAAAILKSRADFQKEKIDITIPARRVKRGHLHPLTIIQNEVEDIFTAMGFEIAEGPEAETEWYNFDALNIPANHPARDEWDTFWLRSNQKFPISNFQFPNKSQIPASPAGRLNPKIQKILLRTHTSPVQVRYMETHKPPFRIIAPGRCFRHEATDAAHEHTFYQFEALMVGDDISIGHLKFIAKEFFDRFFKKDVKIRLRPSFFPFTEPSFEFDISCTVCGGKGCPSCKKEGWLEVAGAGMVNQQVFVNAGYPRGRYAGFAWGFGLERLAMMKYKIDDIRLFHSGDLRFIKQF
jgi:phenylalanyl-tRNA synthetase alpha chain